MDREVKISLDALNRTLQYLIERPYKEVVDIIGHLKATIKEVKIEEAEKEESDTVKPNSADPTGTGVVE